MPYVLVGLLGAVVLISASLSVIYYDEAIGRFRSDRRWGVLISPVTIFFPYFYEEGAERIRRKATLWMGVTWISTILLLIAIVKFFR